MRGHVLALAVLLVACADETLPPDLSDSPGALHNQVIEEFYRVYDGDDEIGSMLEATRRVLPGVDVDADDVRMYAREAQKVIESRLVEDPDALARELVHRGILPRADVPAFTAWVRDPSSKTPFAHRELAADVRSHSAALWAAKIPSTDEMVVDISDMVGALIGFHLGGSIGSILGGTLTSLAVAMLQNSDEGDDFWNTWTGPLPPLSP